MSAPSSAPKPLALRSTEVSKSMITANPSFRILSCIALSQGCYGNIVSGSGSGAVGETATNPGASTAVGGGSTTTTGTSSFGPADPSTSSELESSAGTNPGTTTDNEPMSMGCSDPIHDARRTVFVTAGIFKGDLRSPYWEWGFNENGARRGDIICQCAAAQAGLPGKFIAWLSNADTGEDWVGDGDVRDFIEDNNNDEGSWSFVDTKNYCIAESWTNFIDGSHERPVQRDEHGNLIPDMSTRYAWTGSTASGEATISTCNSWSDASPFSFGTIGEWRLSSSQWSASAACDFSDPTPCACDRSRHLYCIQTSENTVPATELHQGCLPGNGG